MAALAIRTGAVMTRMALRDVAFIGSGALLAAGVPHAAFVIGVWMAAWGLLGLICLWFDGR